MLSSACPSSILLEPRGTRQPCLTWYSTVRTRDALADALPIFPVSSPDCHIRCFSTSASCSLISLCAVISPFPTCRVHPVCSTASRLLMSALFILCLRTWRCACSAGYSGGQGIPGESLHQIVLRPWHSWGSSFTYASDEDRLLLALYHCDVLSRCTLLPYQSRLSNHFVIHGMCGLFKGDACSALEAINPECFCLHGETPL